MIAHKNHLKKLRKQRPYKFYPDHFEKVTKPVKNRDLYLKQAGLKSACRTKDTLRESSSYRVV